MKTLILPPFQRSVHYLAVLLFFLFLVFPVQAAVQDSVSISTPPLEAEQSAPAETKLDSARAQLAAIAASIQDRRQHMEELRQRLAAAHTASEKAELEHEINELEQLIQASRASFESIATGGVDSGIFREQPPQAFDWQKDFFEIIEPVLDQLKQMTETPRAIERLNKEIAEQEGRLVIIHRAASNIANVRSGIEDEALSQRVYVLERSWQQRGSDVELELELLCHRLSGLREEHLSFWTTVHQGLLNFVTGRGLILAKAFFAAGAVWFLLQALHKAIRRRGQDQAEAVRKPHFRLLTYGYQAFCGILSLIALLLVLYVSGDSLLLGIALIILVFVAIGSKNYLPRFMSEARLLLDMGPVRERERVIYNGIPWQVKSLNMYSTLFNPELQGGSLRIPLADLSNMISRPDDPDEPWFPTRKGDFALLSDGTYGQVLLQTPEIVQLNHVGAVRTYPTGDFLRASPRNLSCNGFGFIVIFGIDYQHQAICLEDVPNIFKTAIAAAFKRSPVGDYLESVLVDFKEAGPSSLDYLIHVVINGNAARSYWAVGRIIQQACVLVCNERGWIIPFTQLTVHQGDGFNALRTARSET